jgi:hypothetical protein
MFFNSHAAITSPLTISGVYAFFYSSSMQSQELWPLMRPCRKLWWNWILINKTPYVCGELCVNILIQYFPWTYYINILTTLLIVYGPLKEGETIKFLPLGQFLINEGWKIPHLTYIGGLTKYIFCFKTLIPLLWMLYNMTYCWFRKA